MVREGSSRLCSGHLSSLCVTGECLKLGMSPPPFLGHMNSAIPKQPMKQVLYVLFYKEGH